MNAKKHKVVFVILFAVVLTGTAPAESARQFVHRGNQFYLNGEYPQAVDKYDQALSQEPTATEPKFNKANSYYKLDDLEKAMNLYREVAAQSKDMQLVAKAKYNLGNSHFQEGLKQRDSDLRKAIEEFETAIGHWRSVLDIEPGNEKAAKNIEVARLIIKDILDQLKNQQQQDANQVHEPNSASQQQQSPQAAEPNQPQQKQEQENTAQQQQEGSQKQQGQQATSQPEPNEPQDTNQAAQQRQKQEQQQVQPDATAERIIDKEQQRRKARQMRQAVRYGKVEMDW